MTRPTRKREEQVVVDKFVKGLCSKGHNVSIDQTIVDHPDLVLDIDGERVGCELTTITKQNFEKWRRESLDPGMRNQMVFSHEPGKWLVALIVKKSKKAQTYRAERKFKSLWLLVHVGDLPAFGNDEYTVQLLRYVASSIGQDFDQIWYLGEHDYIEKLWTKGDLPVEEPKLPEDYKDRIIYTKIKIDASKGGRIPIDLGDSPPSPVNDDLSRMMLCAYTGDVKQLQLLLGSGIAPNERDSRGNSALRYAVGAGHIEAVELLTRYGADSRGTYENGITLEELALVRGFSKIAELLSKQQQV